MPEAIVAQNLTKTIGWWSKQTIVDQVSFTLNAGEILGLLGPNGAGKTTTMKILLGLTHMTSGSAFLFGVPVPSPASRVGVGFLPELIHHPHHLTVIEYLRFHARLNGVGDTDSDLQKHLERVDMWEFRNQPLVTCSKGMRQRADIARLLLCNAKLILLDEPFSGLDPCGQVVLKDLLLELKQQQIAILVNSHAAGILEEVCDRVCIMNRGKIIVSDRLQNLLQTSQIELHAHFANPDDMKPILENYPQVKIVTNDSHNLQIRFDKSVEIDKLVQSIFSARGTILRLAPVTLSLDQLFVKILAKETNAEEMKTH